MLRNTLILETMLIQIFRGDIDIAIEPRQDSVIDREDRKNRFVQ